MAESDSGPGSAEPVAGPGRGVFSAAALEFFAGTAGAGGIAGHYLGSFFQIGVVVGGGRLLGLFFEFGSRVGHSPHRGLYFLVQLLREAGFHLGEGDFCGLEGWVAGWHWRMRSRGVAVGSAAGGFEDFGNAGETSGVTTDTAADFPVGLGLAELAGAPADALDGGVVAENEKVAGTVVGERCGVYGGIVADKPGAAEEVGCEGNFEGSDGLKIGFKGGGELTVGGAFAFRNVVAGNEIVEGEHLVSPGILSCDAERVLSVRSLAEEAGKIRDSAGWVGWKLLKLWGWEGENTFEDFVIV